MTAGDVSQRTQELAAEGAAFVTATVVRAQRPTSAQAGDVALVLGDGTIEGFVGGLCAEHTVRAYALKAIESGEPLLLRIVPDAPVEVSSEEGAVTVLNTCLSGGAIEIFLNPMLPTPRVVVVGATPIATALVELGPTLGLDLVHVDEGAADPSSGDLAVVVAAHGRDELHTLRRGLEAGVPYIGLVASPKRGAGVLEELRADGVPEDQLERIDVPAGLDIGARTPAEVALSILAEIVAVRRGKGIVASRAARAAAAPAAPRSAPAPIAVDPICGMTVAAAAGTPSLEHGGETVYFCCEGCAAEFRARHGHAVVTE
jgi:xanthine dehydrogenase accessory factor